MAIDNKYDQLIIKLLVDIATRAKINSLNLGLTMDKQRYIQGSSQIKR